MEIIEFITATWPIFVGFISLVIILAKMHASIETLQEKVKTLFDLYNNIKDNKDK